MFGNDRIRLLRTGAVALCAGVVIWASAPHLFASRPKLAQAAAPGQTRYPEGLEWMAGPPERGIGVALVKTSDIAVGLVVVDGAKTGQTISASMVALSKNPGDTSSLEGLVLVDPAGKQHPVSVGKIVTFALGAAPAITLLKDGRKLGTQSLPVGGAPPIAQGQPLAQSNRITNLSGAFDGNAANSTAKIGDTELRVIAETPSNMVVASPNLPVSGPCAIQVSDNGAQRSLPGNVLNVEVKGPAQMKLGQRSAVEVVLRGLEQFRKVKPGEARLYAYLVNDTPHVATFDRKARVISRPIDVRKITHDGAYRLTVGLTAVGPGTYRIVGSVTTSAYGCELSCAGCDTFMYCDDKGTVVCAKGECRGGCGGHKGGCGKSFSCDCKFGTCGC